MSIDLTAAIETQLRAGTPFHDVGPQVFAQIASKDYEDALRRTLPLLVKRVQREMERSTEPTEANAAKRVCVRKGEWKFLNDCSAREIRSVADGQRQFAETQRAWAARYDHLADAMEQQSGADRRRARPRSRPQHPQLKGSRPLADTEPVARSFATWLQEQRNGLCQAEATDALKELTAAVTEHQKGGTLTLKLTVKPAKVGIGTLLITDEVKVSLPEGDRPAAIFYADDDGNLSRHDPRQPRLPLQALDGGARDDSNPEEATQ